jgi:adenosylcobinamide-phosphate synthase
MNMMASSLYLVLAAILLDLLIGDPKWIPHPVIIIGKVISYFERTMNRGKSRKIKGILTALTIVGGTLLSVYLLLYLANLIHPFLEIILEIYLISSTIAIKGLQQAAREVALPLLNGDIDLARKKLSYIVGRDTETLPPREVTRGTVETVAENTVDAIIAPLCWALIGGAPLAMVYRAINTLDSMVGYKNDKYEQFGWASARLDDVVNWIPARLTAIFLWLFSWIIPHSQKWNAVIVTARDAKKHPSPNSGWPEAMVAGLLGVVLGGMNKYQGVESYRQEMGNPLRELDSDDIKKAITFMHGAWIVFVILLFTISSL